MTVQPVGTDARGDMALPPNPRVAGWYRFGPTTASRAGAVVIAAHVDDRRLGVGPLARLDTLERGDAINVMSSAGAQRYHVSMVLRLAKGQLDLEEVFDRDGPPRLHLVTCGGAFDPRTGHYEDNVVVLATPTG